MGDNKWVEMGKQENSKERSNRIRNDDNNKQKLHKGGGDEDDDWMTLLVVNDERSAKWGRVGERYGVDCNQITSYNKMFIIMKCNAYEI